MEFKSAYCAYAKFQTQKKSQKQQNNHHIHYSCETKHVRNCEFIQTYILNS